MSVYEKPVPFWNVPRSLGSHPLFATPKELWDGAIEYFAWVDEHPLQEQLIFHHKGALTKTMGNKARPYTLTGLCTFLGITRATYHKTCAQTGFEEVKDLLDQIIYTQKFEGAAAGFFNANIMVRDLGLVDKSEQSGPNGGPMRMITSEMTPQEAAEAYAATLSGEQS